MKTKIDCFIPYTDVETAISNVAQFSQCVFINRIYLLAQDAKLPQVNGCQILLVDSLRSASTMRLIATAAKAPYVAIYLKDSAVTLGYKALERMAGVLHNTGRDMAYSDRYAVKSGQLTKAPTIDYQLGSVRNDFDFGSLILCRSSRLKAYAADYPDSEWTHAGMYEMTLFMSRREGGNGIVRIGEYLYTEEESDLRKSGEKQFDYVDPSNRQLQIEMEGVCTDHLKRIGAYIDNVVISDVAVEKYDFDIEASVIIPVRNREKTVEDAVKSALSQKTDFTYNVIVIDNHSTDTTTDKLKALSEQYDNLIHIIPEQTDLGIGGCWNLAVCDERCGRFAIQLDSDDLYSGDDTLQRIVDKFYAEKCAMVIGSYRMCNFQLETLPPGIIDHREWTDSNGRNNALRINGLGAPRAFFTPLLRKVGVPNTCYGEDYALGLSFSRQYRIGRIYDELYLCRRWDGNSDAALTPEKVNANNLYKDSLRSMEIMARQRHNSYWSQQATPEDAKRLFDEQLEIWDDARERYDQLKDTVKSDFEVEGCKMSVQFNPARIVSTGAKVDKNTIRRRPCFLCDINRPDEQIELPVLGKYTLLVNPFPILPIHYTIPLRMHSIQCIREHYIDMMELTRSLDGMMVFYNGPLCGASAPDHMHFQAGSRGVVPLERDWNELYRGIRSRIYPISDEELFEAVTLEEMADDTGIFSLRGYVCPGIIIVTRTPEANEKLFNKVYDAMPIVEGETEPMMNILSWTMNSESDGTQRIVSVIIPRRKHRPECYFAEGDDKLLVSPGALDMGGMIITPREEDFRKLSPRMAADVIREVAYTLDDEQMLVMAIKGGDK